MKTKIIILAGGSGSRLWPYSRKSYPKQILKLIGDTSLLQQTVLRFNKNVDKENIHVITNTNQSHLIKNNINEIGFDHEELIIEEPFSRNTAAAILLAALKLDPEDIMVILPSDHIIKNVDYFNEVIEQSTKLAEKGYLVTLGIEPKYPETGYGYIEAGKVIENNEYFVSRFVEKPNLETAKDYLEKGNYFWNSGMFIWKVDTIINEFKNLKPQLNDTLKKYLDSGDSRYFYDAEDISIDYAILESSKNVAVIKADLEWSDLGSWKSVFDIQEKDTNHNVINGDSIIVDSTNVFVQNTSDDRTVAVVGINDITVIDTDDAVIICDLNKTQDVKKVVDQLKVEKSDKTDHHKTVYRPWGFYKILEDTDYFKSKRLVIYPGQSISLQYHLHRSESWTVVKGTAFVIRGEEELEVTVGQSVSIPAGYNHRLINKSNINVELIEVQTGSYFGEDDIVRLEDQYSRLDES